MNDKLKHFFASAVITIVVLILFLMISHGYWWGWDKGIALACGVFAGAAKEFVWDKWLKKGIFEWRDLESSVLGSFTAMFLWLIVETIVYVIKYGF